MGTGPGEMNRSDQNEEVRIYDRESAGTSMAGAPADTHDIGSKSPEEIRGEIQHTRTRLSHTVDAIQYKLAPSRLREEAKASVRDATIGRFESIRDGAQGKAKGVSSDVIETIKKNPVPAALTAVGLGWLLMERRNVSGQERRWRQEDRYYRSGYAARGGYDLDYEGVDYYPEERYQAERRMRDQGPGTRERVSEAASGAREKASETVEDVKERVSDTASEIQDRVSSATMQAREEARYRAQRARSRFEQMMDENPLLVGAAALALGTAIGLSLPLTQRERELMGEARDDLLEKAQQKASETVDKVQQVAQEAGQAAKDAAKQEAEKQNLPSG